MTSSIVKNIGLLPEGTWQRRYAEIALSKGQRLVAMADIPDRWFDRFALEQRRTVNEGFIVYLELDEFVRVALVTLSAAESPTGERLNQPLSQPSL